MFLTLSLRFWSIRPINNQRAWNFGKSTFPAHTAPWRSGKPSMNGVPYTISQNLRTFKVPFRTTRPLSCRCSLHRHSNLQNLQLSFKTLELLLGAVVPRPEEVELCSMLQECMELRKKYVSPICPPWHSDKPLTNGLLTLSRNPLNLHLNHQTFKPHF
jgi:hypothetical protein